jgi:hypothetical protein
MSPEGTKWSVATGTRCSSDKAASATQLKLGLSNQDSISEKG